MLPHDLESNSSTLIDKSHKHIAPDDIESSAIVNEYLQFYSSNPTQNFINPSYNGYSNHSEPMLRTNVPIPFLQNVNSENTVPKQSNIPRPNNRGKKINWNNFKKFFESKRKSDDISPQIDCNVKSNLIANENGANLSTPTVSLETKFETRVDLTGGKAEIKIAPPEKEELKYSTILKISQPEGESTDRDLLLLGTQNNRRPNTLPLLKHGEFQSCNNGKGRNNVRNVDKMLRNIEKSNAKQKALNSEKVKKRRSLGPRNESREERNAKARSLSEIDELKILRLESKIEEAFNKNLKILDTVSQKTLVRPNDERANKPSPKVEEKTCTAKDNPPNTSQNCKVSLEEVFTKSDSLQLKDPSSRIKTPGDVPLAVRKIRRERNAARFSLYDDRIMSGCYENDTLYGYTTNNNNNRKRNGEYDQIFSSFEDIKFSQNI